VAGRPCLYAAGVTDTAFEAQTGAGVIAGAESGDGPALLLLHGGPAMSDYMSLLGPEVEGWRAVRYQQRGLAPSSTDGPFTLQQHVADAVAVLDARGVDRAVVLGHSWGSHLALHLAVAHPERVAGLVLVDGLGAVGDGGVTELGQEMVSRLSPESLARLMEVGERLGGPDPSDDDATEQTRLLWPAYFADPASAAPWPPHIRVSLAAYAGTFASVAEQLGAGFAQSLAGITVPAVFVLGERSPMPVSQGQQTAALIPGAEVEVIPGAGHLPWHEQPGSVAAALARVRAAVR
jgi:pimeloyl-ACP methyl ester carboxylesterase